MLRKTFCLSIVLCLLGFIEHVPAKDMYYYLPLKDLRITRGKLPDSPEVHPAVQKISRRRSRLLRDFMYPRAIGNNREEIYLVFDEAGRLAPDSRPLSPDINNMYITIRASKEAIPSGLLFLPKPDWSGMNRLGFSATPPVFDQEFARESFLKAKEQHYKRLLALGIPGAAWFRHQIREARLAREGELPEEGINVSSTRGRRRSELEDTYLLFSGGRAISENLRLNRELRVVSPANETVPVDSIEGISIAKIDWEPLVKGLNPEKDMLAVFVPADQHVLFFPSFQAMLDLIDESAARGTPILRLLEVRSEDAQVHERYRQQLCLPLSALARIMGSQLVKSVAFTGSDPYLRTGSDVAVLFEAVNPEALKAAIATRQTAAKTTVPGIKTVDGHVQDIFYSGVISPNRSICSYIASLGNIVVVTNSVFQLERIVQASKKQIPAIVTLDEYAFFRDRYKRGDTDETALLIVTDATIRHWCGPRWRIAASRRTRITAALAELQATYLDDLTAGQTESKLLTQERSIPDIGDVQITPNGIISSTYGSLEFLTPILEIPLEKVTPEEVEAYEWFRRNYQRGWRQFFDPIAIRFSLQPDRLVTDITVRPLIVASEYREYMELTGDVTLFSDTGDQHNEALAHYVMSLDTDSLLMREIENFAMMIASDALNWVGKWGALYVDEDPFWQDFENIVNKRGQEGAEYFIKRNYTQFPVAVAVDVADALKLAAFLTSLRMFIEQTAPGLIVWETLKHNDQSYVRIAPSDKARYTMPGELRDFAIYYATTPRMFVLSLRKEFLERALDRIVAQKKAPAESKDLLYTGKPWLGESLGLQVSKNAFALLQTLLRDSMNIALERRAWGNIIILNEWRRRYSQMSPGELHQKFWQTKLVCPGGGEYVWNKEFQTMESTVFGHPGQPRAVRDVPNPLSGITKANMGITFEDDGLRAQAEIRRKARGEN